MSSETYKIWFDEKEGVLYVKTFKTIDAEDIHRLMPEVDRLLEGKPHRYILGDLSKNPSDLLTKEARQAFKHYADRVQYDKIGVIGVNPVTRMVVKIAIKIIGQADKTRFFKTEDDALAWFKEDS